MRLLVIDIDGTLCASPPVGAGGFDEWERLILAGGLEPIPGAAEALAVLLPRHDRTLLLTARSERLRVETRIWINRHFPALCRVPLSMRAEYDPRDPALTKWDRLSGLRGLDRMTLIDDDARMKIALLPGDSFVSAPDDYRAIVRR